MRVTMTQTTIASDDHVTPRTYLNGQTYEVTADLGAILIAQADAKLADPASPVSLVVFEIDCGSPLGASATALHSGVTGSTAAQVGVTAGLSQPDVARNGTVKANAAGSAQIETATVVGTITAVTGGGNATVVVTAAGLAGSPKTYSVPVVASDSATVVAGKIRTALGLDAALTTLFTVGGSGALITLTATSPQANDGTLNIATDNGTCTGLTTEAASANTNAGVAGVTGDVTLHISLGGVPDTETITLSGSSAVAGLKAFDTILSVDRPAGGGTVAIGTGELICLRRTMPLARVIAVYHNGVAEKEGKSYAVDSVTADSSHPNLTVVDMAKLGAASNGNPLVVAVWG